MDPSTCQRLKPVLVQTAYAALKAPLFHTNPARG